MRVSYGESQLSAKNPESGLGRVSRGCAGTEGWRGQRVAGMVWEGAGGGSRSTVFGCLCQALAVSFAWNTSAQPPLTFCVPCGPSQSHLFQ